MYIDISKSKTSSIKSEKTHNNIYWTYKTGDTNKLDKHIIEIKTKLYLK